VWANVSLERRPSTAIGSELRSAWEIPRCGAEDCRRGLVIGFASRDESGSSRGSRETVDKLPPLESQGWSCPRIGRLNFWSESAQNIAFGLPYDISLNAFIFIREWE
jgi:hypothetical protein